MKGGSLAGNFFRFLSGESEKDRINLKELKELDEYKKQQQQQQEKELDEHINANNKKLSIEQENELNTYTNDKEIIDGNDFGINDLNKNIRENDEIDVLSQKGGGMIDSINKIEKMNFDNWYTGSTNAYTKVVQKNDPAGDEYFDWERKVVDNIPFHQKATGGDIQVENDTKGCPMQGGRRRKKRKKITRKRSGRSR